MYAIIDIETTGGKYNQEGITEIAIYRFDGHEVTDRFVSLLNPQRKIQSFVVKLTGISNKMVRSAPKFHEVAKRIVEITDGCILVAHNAEFDYRMLRTEFQRLGYEYKRKTICTVELSRALIPGKETYSLGKLVRSLGIPISNRHRADGDARATTQLFKLLLAKDSAKTIIKRAINEEPTSLNSTWLNIINSLPTRTGVYYMHKKNGDILYIGKGKNIQGLVNRHFTGSSLLSKAIREHTAFVTYEETGTTLIASLKAEQEIRENNPPHNPKRKAGPAGIPEDYSYPHNNMVIVDKGRTTGERSAVLIENNLFQGFGFFDLNYQIKNIRILHSIITPMEHNNEVNLIIKSYLRRNKKLKIVSF